MERSHLLHEEPADQVQVLRDGKLASELMIGWRRLDPVIALAATHDLVEQLVKRRVVQLRLRDGEEDRGDLFEVVLPIEHQIVPLGALRHPVACRAFHLPGTCEYLVDRVVVFRTHLREATSLTGGTLVMALSDASNAAGGKRRNCVGEQRGQVMGTVSGGVAYLLLDCCH